MAVSEGDGNTQGGYVYTCRTTVAPRLATAKTNANLKLSWIIPSTNFVLEQSADLAGWATVTNEPILNFTNLQNQVIVFVTNETGYYRLRTP